MQCGIIVLGLVMILKGYLCNKREGVCNYTQPDKAIDGFIPLTLKWKIYGYIESGAPYRNPFYIHYNESPQCSNIEIGKSGNREIYLSLQCKGIAVFGSPCKMIELVNNNTVRFNYVPNTIETDCKEWNTITRLHKNEDFIILFGCENGDDNSHYVGLWVFIREYEQFWLRNDKGPAKKISKEEELTINMKMLQIIDNEYGDIKQDIKFIPNWSDDANCSCFQERIYSNTKGLTRCNYERLDTCEQGFLKQEAMTPINTMVFSMKKYGFGSIILILLFVLMWYLAG